MNNKFLCQDEEAISFMHASSIYRQPVKSKMWCPPIVYFQKLTKWMNLKKQ